MFNETHVLHTTLVLTAMLSIGFLAFSLDIALGIILGGLMGVLAFKLIIIDTTRLLSVAKTTNLSKKQVSRFSRRAFLKRCSLYGATLIVAIVNPYVSFLATLGGLLLPRVAIIFLLLRGRISRGT
ncbi:MAG: twin-arginine translocation signal domain-containing protein [Firmicutes bacterium]|nr:twin-arginine translocation signal domain-containing protein [Bacillota bacterium]